MCKKCQEAKNKWWRRIVMKWEDTSMDSVRRIINKVFGKGSFVRLYKGGRLNYDIEVVCKFCGTKFHIASMTI